MELTDIETLDQQLDAIGFAVSEIQELIDGQEQRTKIALQLDNAVLEMSEQLQTLRDISARARAMIELT